MRRFYYLAYDEKGRKVLGEMLGETQSAVESALKDKGLKPAEVRDAGSDEETQGVPTGYDAAYYRRRRGQQITIIPVSLALMGLALYGCHVMEMDWKTTLIASGVPALWLALGILGFVRYGRLVRKAEATK
ncbi:MAG TPA: hypothetical protein VG733_08080 [Chthoniobacteraceae bacterium]|nr:hypothetical protein [Chthoniobacteraceae bacterium]